METESFLNSRGILVEYWHKNGLCFDRNEMLALLGMADGETGEEEEHSATDDDDERLKKPLPRFTILRRQTSSRPTGVRFPFDKPEEVEKMKKLILDDIENIIGHVVHLVDASKTKGIERVNVESLTPGQVHLVTGMCQMAGLESYALCKTEMCSVFCSAFNAVKTDSRCGCVNVPLEYQKSSLRILHKLGNDFDFDDPKELAKFNCTDPAEGCRSIVFTRQFVDGVVIMLMRTPRTPRGAVTPPLPMATSK
jgi:hypothetical protein